MATPSPIELQHSAQPGMALHNAHSITHVQTITTQPNNPSLQHQSSQADSCLTPHVAAFIMQCKRICSPTPTQAKEQFASFLSWMDSKLCQHLSESVTCSKLLRYWHQAGMSKKQRSACAKDWYAHCGLNPIIIHLSHRDYEDCNLTTGKCT